MSENLQSNRNEFEIIVERGYQPNQIVLRAGESGRLTFIRRSKSFCTKELVFPLLKLRAELPVNEPFIVEIPPLPAGEYPFACGMNMLKGSVIVRDL
jgi:Cu+-exporting ATPase